MKQLIKNRLSQQAAILFTAAWNYQEDQTYNINAKN